MYVSDLKPICDLDLNTILFVIKNPYRSTKKSLTGAQNPYRCANFTDTQSACKGFLHTCKHFLSQIKQC